MSTKTTFKRIALVAVAALGLGVLSVAPSQATISGLTVVGVNGTSTNSADSSISDSTTAATVSVNALLDASSDSITVAFISKSVPSVTPNAFFYYLESTTAYAARTKIDTTTNVTYPMNPDSVTAGLWSVPAVQVASASDTSTGLALGDGRMFRLRGSTAGYVGATFAIQLDSASVRAAGTYVYTVVVKGYSGSAAVQTVTQDVSIVVAAATGASKVVDPSKSSATLSAGASLGTAAAGTDSAVATLATASATVKGSIRVINRNASLGNVAESITVTVTGPGVVRKASEASAGKSIVVVGTGSDDIEILSDGTAGTASIVVRTTSVTYAAKTVTFFAAAAKTAAASANKPVIAVGTNSSVVVADLKDANGATWAGTAYIWAASAADALIAGSETPAACTYTASIAAHLCDVSGKLAGTANFIVADSDSKTATTTTKSNSVAVRVSTGTPTTVKLAFDKATYAPGEKAQVWVTAVDAAGLALAEQTINNLFATGGISSSTALGTGSDTLTATSVALAGATSATAGTVAGYKVYTVYMPFASGDVKITATGGTGVALAGRVEVSATATVVNSSVDAATDAANEATDAANAATDAALAAADAADAATAAAQDASDAVAALSASVSKLISSLRAQITSLTNLVIKIQKKVRA
jgi:trimeric autotransporter adhesin